MSCFQNGAKSKKCGVNNTKNKKMPTIKINSVLRILLNGCDTLNNTVKDVTVAVITISVETTTVSISNVLSNPNIIKLLIITTNAPGSAALIMFNKNLPLTCL